MNRASKLLLSIFAIGLFSVAPAIAQSAAPEANSAVTPYDMTKEIKVQGTIQKIETSGGSGPIGTHILIQTTDGVVDAHLGFGPAVKPSTLGITEGQSVAVIGMMQNLDGGSVLLARVLTTSSRVILLRSERGIPVRAFPSSNVHSGSMLQGGL